MIARPLWHSWSNGLAFITSALASGGALVYGIAGLTAPQLVKESAGLRKLILSVIIIHLIVGLGHSGLEAKLPEAMAQLTDWKYWVLFVGLGAAGALLFSKAATAVWGSLLALLSIIAYKVSFVSAAFTEAAFPGLPQAFQNNRLTLAYSPSTVEWLVAIGLLSLVLLAIMLAVPKVLNKAEISGKNDSLQA
jgi:Ni/Fe-hydrogenase subunit HybB-like protein